MNQVFTEDINSFILVYPEDVLIYSRTLEEHWDHLRKALQKLQDAKLYGRLHKCEFLKERVEYLGFEVSKDGVHASPEKVRAVVDWPRPQAVKDVRSFLGLASFYRRFIRGFSAIARPLTDLTKAKAKWTWGNEEETSFRRLKVALATAPVLVHPDFSKEFVVTTDASDYATGAVLQQDHGEGLQPIAFASRKLNPTECRYGAYERELLGIVWAIGQWRHYLQGRHFIVQTDHSSLRHLINQPSVNSRVWKWANLIQGYDVDIRHIPGKVNPADSFTRQQDVEGQRLIAEAKEKEATLVKALKLGANAMDAEIQSQLDKIFGGVEEDTGAVTAEVPKLAVLQTSIQVDGTLRQQIIEAVSDEEPYATIMSELQTPGPAGGTTNEVLRGNKKYRLRHGALYVHIEGRDVGEYWKLIIPDHREVKATILREIHSVPYSGHPGFQRTLSTLQKTFHWHGMVEDVREYVSSCPVCQTEKSDHTLS